MKKILPLLLILLAVSCSKPAAKADLSLKEGVATNVELYRLDLNRLTLLDSLATDAKGRLSCTLPLADAENPAFFYLYHNDTRLAGIVAADKDRIQITADTMGRFQSEGSQDTRLLKEMDDRLAESKAKMEAILAQAPEDENRQLSKVYIDHKRALLRQVMENPYSITSAAALFQKFNDQLYVFQEPSDKYIFKAIRDSLLTRYPSHPFVSAVSKAIEQRDNSDRLSQMLDSVATFGMPEIKMNDIHGKQHSMSSLKGKVILLSFWSIEQNEHKVFNQEMVPVYNKFHDRGFEIYQVCVDPDKAAWATIVRNQNLPWICVNDGLGLGSPAVASYNLNSIPTMFIISRDSDILARDIYDPAEIEKIVSAAL